MDKYDNVYYNTNKLLRLLSSNNAPDWLQKEFRDYISYYMQNTTWLARSKFQELTNGCYVGDTDTEGRRHGEGIYMFDDGDVYIGSYISGSKHGDGFYYDASSNTLYKKNNGTLEYNYVLSMKEMVSLCRTIYGRTETGCHWGPQRLCGSHSSGGAGRWPASSV